MQRWTNAATSRHPISEKLDEVQSNVRLYNDLCQRAIILGSTIIGGEQIPNDDVIRTNKGAKRIDSGKERVGNDGNANKEGKVPVDTQIANVGPQGVFQQMLSFV
ncbi:Hypothetical predicted protein [Olea europaea subsp. europaea]|uniref:Uncharacterized protein n=1 Tax=Olea europaea subsp. europaea TaxID=158383 RepID=A0A8S0S1F6_OLEEU|nr:Hypothetical predicted protein [Olea europaea subsp. europaea]